MTPLIQVGLLKGPEPPVPDGNGVGESVPVAFVQVTLCVLLGRGGCGGVLWAKGVTDEYIVLLKVAMADEFPGEKPPLIVDTV
jgi:hypothetical protein